MNTSKKISVLVVALLCATAFILFGFKQKNTEESPTVIVRCTQIATLGGKNSAIRVYYGNQRIETIDLEPYTMANEPQNYDEITTVLNLLLSEGYEIISSSETGFGTNGFVNTYVLKKKS